MCPSNVSFADATVTSAVVRRPHERPARRRRSAPEGLCASNKPTSPTRLSSQRRDSATVRRPPGGLVRRPASLSQATLLVWVLDARRFRGESDSARAPSGALSLT